MRNSSKLRIEFDSINLEVPFEALGNKEETKQWIWENCREAILAGMNLSNLQANGGDDNVTDLISVPWTQKSKQPELESRIELLETENARLRESERISRRAASSQLRYFACMSHEIRTPLSCIIGMSQMLVDMDLEPQQQELLKVILSSSDLLLAVVNDVLDWSKLETGSYKVLVRESNLQQVLDSTVRSIQMQAQTKQIRIATSYDSSVPEFLTTDSRRLQQILYNLLGNAIKFSKEGGEVRLAVKIVDNSPMNDLSQILAREEEAPKSSQTKTTNGLTLTDAMLANLWTKSSQDSLGESIRRMATMSSSSLSDFIDESMTEGSVSSCNASKCHETTSSESSQKRSIRFEVTDYGIGINEEDIRKIFLPFHQESSVTESTYGGTGLGLTIAYKLVEALGGCIAVESKVGRFTRFTVDLPFPDNRIVSCSLPNTRVLLINDEWSSAATLHTFTEYAIAFDVFPNMTAAAVELSMKRDTTDHYICLLNECLYEADCAAQLKECNIPLISFGPKYATQRNVDAHIMSLEQTLPSVLVKILRNSILQKADSVRSSKSSLLSHKEVQGCVYEKPQNLRVLIAEDNLINQKILSRMLFRLGIHNVDIVDNGEKAIEKESTNEYDLIFMDVLMPKVDGVQACEAIQRRRRRQRQGKPYIVFVTAYISTEFKETCRVAGGDEVLTKPFHIEEISAALARAAASRDNGNASTVSLQLAVSS